MGSSTISLLVFLISAFHLVEMSPSPSPTPAAQPQRLPCDGVSDKCDIDIYSVTACVTFVGNGSQVSYLTVLNNGESSLQLEIVVRPSPTDVKLEGSETISGHQVKKVNLPSNMRGDSSVLLKVGNGECTIQLQALIPQGFYTTYMTPMNGTYLLFAAALLIGGGWACCRFVIRRRHLDGVPYRELEMERRESHSTIETHDEWDKNWDNDWDEEKAVRSPGSIRTRNVSENVGSLK